MNRVAGVRFRFLENQLVSAILSPFSMNYSQALKDFPELVDAKKSEADSPYYLNPLVIGFCGFWTLDDENFENLSVLLFNEAKILRLNTSNSRLESLDGTLKFVFQNNFPPISMGNAISIISNTPSSDELFTIRPLQLNW
jgi:hypothetical protein